MRTRAVLILAMLAGPLWADETKTKDADLEIYLPRETRIAAERLKLGEITVVRSVDRRLAEKAADVAMGRSPWPGERLVLSQATIRGRLVSVGIPAASVWFSGAPKITVRRKEISVSPQLLREAAGEFLAENRPDLVDKIVPMGVVRALHVAGTQPVELEGELMRLSYSRMVAVKVTALRGKKPFGSSTVLFRHVKEPSSASPRPPEAPAKPRTASPSPAPRPAVAVRAAAPAAPVRSVTTGYQPVVSRRRPAEPRRPAVLIRSGQQVRMRVRGPGFLITGLGQAMQDGRQGNVIRVRNVDTLRVINATVAPDGAVEPLIR